MENVSSEQELLELLKEGKINVEEYGQLLEAMRKSPPIDSKVHANARRKYIWRIISIVVVIITITILLSLGTFLIVTRGDIDLAIAGNGFTIRPYPEGGLYTLTVSILNQGDKTSPRFRVKFYRGDPANNLDERGKPHSGFHNAGPIKPGDGWNECTRPFALAEGVNEMVVVLDPDNLVAETDETNNRASLRAVVSAGKITEAK